MIKHKGSIWHKKSGEISILISSNQCQNGNKSMESINQWKSIESSLWKPSGSDLSGHVAVVNGVAWRKQRPQQKPYPLNSQKKRLTYCFPFHGQAWRACLSGEGAPQQEKGSHRNPQSLALPLPGNGTQHPKYLCAQSGSDSSQPLRSGT